MKKHDLINSIRAIQSAVDFYNMKEEILRHLEGKITKEEAK